MTTQWNYLPTPRHSAPSRLSPSPVGGRSGQNATDNCNLHQLIPICHTWLLRNILKLAQNLSKTILVPELVPKGLRDQRWQRCAVKLRKVPLITVPPPTKKTQQWPRGRTQNYLLSFDGLFCLPREERNITWNEPLLLAVVATKQLSGWLWSRQPLSAAPEKPSVEK